MSLLTPSMKTNRKDYAGENLKLFFPFNEGSGTTFTDIIGGVAFAEAGATHTVAYAATMATGSSTIAPSAGTMPQVPAGKSVIMIACNIIATSSLFNAVTFGDPSVGAAVGFSLSTSFAVKNSGGATVSAGFSATDTSTQSRLRAGTFNGVTGEIRAYSGINGGAVAFDNTADGAVHVGAFVVPNKLSMGNNDSFTPDFYGAAMLVVDNLPSNTNLLTYLDWTYAELVAGRKVIDPRFKTY